MAYNVISGSILAAQIYSPMSGTVIENIVSGNLSTSNGESIINVPRLSNATNNALITNVGGDANDITCESNLTFDGSALTVTGELTASIGVKASFFEGDGSRLTGLASADLQVEQYGAPPLGTTISSSIDFALIKSGTAKLIGTNSQKIFLEVSKLLNDKKYYQKMQEIKNPFGDGTASRQIVNLCSKFLNKKIVRDF